MLVIQLQALLCNKRNTLMLSRDGFISMGNFYDLIINFMTGIQ